MSQVKQSKAGRSASNVTQLFAMPPDGWELRTGWKVESPFGFMACGKATADRLVRLAEVLRWIQTEQTLPRAEALRVLIGGLPDDVMAWLFRLEPSSGGYAQAVPVDAMFGYQSAAQIETAKAKYRQDLMQRDHEEGRRYGGDWMISTTSGATNPPQWPEPTEPGRPALVKALSKWWALPKWNRAATCDMLDESRCSLSFFAVPVYKAFAVWGWGGVPAADAVAAVAGPKDWPSLVAARKANAGIAWTAEQLAVARAEWSQRGGTAANLVTMAAELGISRQSMSKTMTAPRMRGRAQPAAAPASAKKTPKRA